MYQVSTQYLEQIRKPIRNFSYIKIMFGLTDPDADSEAVISNNGQMPWSENPEVENLHSVNSVYATLELNRWVLNGKQNLLPDSAPYNYQAFVSDKVSNSEGIFENGTVLTITFAVGYYSFSGLTFTFDSFLQDYPATVNVKGYLNNELVYDNTKSIDSVNFEYAEKIPGTNGFINKLVISITGTSLPYRRVRVEDIVLGLLKSITEKVLITSNWKRKNDLMNTTLPDEAFDFTFYDIDKQYNPDNPEGLWEYIETGQQVTFSYGYQLDDGTIEWIPGSKYITDGSPIVENGNTLPQVTFKTVSPIQALSGVYDEGIYSAIAVTLYDLADTILYWAGIHDSSGNKKYVLDESLKNFVTTKPLPVLSVRELLQLIANEGMCLLYTDRQGYITIAPRKTNSSGFSYTFEDMLTSVPSISKYPFLKTLYVKYSLAQPATEVAELTTFEVDNANGELYTIEYDAATSISATASEGVAINEIVGLYAYRAKLRITGTGTVTISGKKLIYSDYVDYKQFNVTGEDCSIETQLIENKTQADNYIDWMSDILTLRGDYVFNDRGFPEVDVCDIINVDTAYTEGKPVYLVGSNISFNGGLNCESEVLG